MMTHSLSWFAKENPEQIQNIYNIINYKSVQHLLLFHNKTVTSCEILIFLNNNVNSEYYKYIERKISETFPTINFYTNNIYAFIILKYIYDNNINKIIFDLPIKKYINNYNNYNNNLLNIYDIILSIKDINFFIPNIVTDVYISEKIDESYNDIFNYTTNLFIRNPNLYYYYVSVKSKIETNTETNTETNMTNFPKLFYIKFSDICPLNGSNVKSINNNKSKLIINKYEKGITFGTFDLFHFGHDNILKRCRNFCEYLCLGLSSDELNMQKGKTSVYEYEKRKNIIETGDEKYVDMIFKEESLEYKNNYVTEMGADILMMGDDWIGKFDWVLCDVLYMERTPNISTTMLKEQINNE